MRNKIIGIIILLIAISLLALGIAQGQQNLINFFYDRMTTVIP
ncbi:MAG: hypothetical protein ACW98X_21445 [Promethearchaeota archaeon]|jgi:hypothetical protein